jgi:hypothetical protein
VRDYPLEEENEDRLVDHWICGSCFDLPGLEKCAGLQANPFPFSASAAFLFRFFLLVAL